MDLIKALERFGRRLIVFCVALVLRRRQRPPDLADDTRVLVVRLDERLGNLLLLTPFLTSLKQRFPQGRIDLLANARGAPAIAAHPTLNAFIGFRKRALFAADGPLRTPFRLRRRRYDLVIDAGNPTDPSVTQALITRICAGVHSIGPAHGAFAACYSAPAAVPASPADDVHEIVLRRALLTPLGDVPPVNSLSAPEFAAPKSDAPAVRFRGRLLDKPIGIVNLGARLADKRLDAKAYATLAGLVQDHGCHCVLTYGPAERELVESVQAHTAGVWLAPPTDVPALAYLFAEAKVVITCDTGPMHLAVAVGTPTLGLFVSTSPKRYGYADAPHGVVDLRSTAVADAVGDIDAWLTARLR